MTNTFDNIESASFEGNASSETRVIVNQHKTEFGSSKSMFEGYFKFNNTFLHVSTNNKQLYINIFLAVVRYLNHVR
jgi:hypothetical protein